MIEETIKDIIKNLKEKISNLENQKEEILDIDELLSLSPEELVKKISKYEIENIDDLINEIQKHNELLTTPTIRKYMSKTLENNKALIKQNIDDINHKIKLKNKEYEEKISKIKEFLEAFTNIYEYLYTENSNISTDNLFNYLEIVKLFPIGNGILLEITSEACKKMLVEHKNIETLDMIIEEQLVNEVNEANIEQFEETISDAIKEVEINQEESFISILSTSLSESRKQKINYATGMHSRFFNEKSADYLGYSAIDCTDQTPLDELEEIAVEEGLYKLFFAMIILKLISNIKDTNLSDDEVELISNKLDSYIEIYNTNKQYNSNIMEKIKSVEMYFEKLLELSKMGLYSSQVPDINKKMHERIKPWIDIYKDYIDTYIVQEKDYKSIEEEYDKLIEELNNFISELAGKENLPTVEPKAKIEINSFVLFSKSSEEQPYILTDLFDSTRSLIDESAINGSKRNQNYQYNISKLIMELFKYSKPIALVSADTSNSNFKSKILSQIYFPNSSGKPDRSRPTDMWRFRPERNSNVRFAEREIKIPRDTKLYTQVVDIIEKIIPNFEISNESDFSLIINIATAIKRTDNELYEKSITRYYTTRIKLLELFYKDGIYFKGATTKNPELKSEFTPIECAIFEEYVKSSIDTLKFMSDKDENYNFTPLLGQGGNTYGL